MTNPTAALIIARARESWSNSPETSGGPDAFDLHIAIAGLQPYGELYQEVYAIANEGHEVVVVGGEAGTNAGWTAAALAFAAYMIWPRTPRR
jgi:hypothetical protein